MKTTSLVSGLVALVLGSQSIAADLSSITAPKSSMQIAMRAMPERKLDTITVRLEGDNYILNVKGRDREAKSLRYLGADLRKMHIPEEAYTRFIGDFLANDFRRLSARRYSQALASPYWSRMSAAGDRVDPTHTPFVLGIGVQETCGGKLVKETTGAPTQGSANGVFQMCKGPYRDAQKMDPLLRKVPYEKMRGTQHIGLQTRAMIAYTKYLTKTFADAGHPEINAVDNPALLAFSFNAGPRFLLHALKTGKKGKELLHEAASVRNFRAAVDEMSPSQRSWYRRHYGPQKAMIALKYGYAIEDYIQEMATEVTE